MRSGNNDVFTTDEYLLQTLSKFSDRQMKFFRNFQYSKVYSVIKSCDSARRLPDVKFDLPFEHFLISIVHCMEESRVLYSLFFSKNSLGNSDELDHNQFNTIRFSSTVISVQNFPSSELKSV